MRNHYKSVLQFAYLCFKHFYLLVRNVPHAVKHRTTVVDVNRVIDQICTLEMFCVCQDRLALFVK